MLFNNCNNKTLGNVKVFIKNNYLFFIRENRNLKVKMKIIRGKTYLFDGRFLIISNKSGKLISSFENNLNIINNQSPFYKYKHIINKSIPCLQTLEGTSITPHLRVIDINTEINKNLDNIPFSLYLINRVFVQ